jgi:hypothetical protein
LHLWVSYQDRFSYAPGVVSLLLTLLLKPTINFRKVKNEENDEDISITFAGGH